MKLKLLIILAAAVHVAQAQKSILLGQAVERVFRSKDSTENFYLALAPKETPNGLLVVLPGFGGYPTDVLRETDLPAKARESGYLVVIPYLAKSTFYTDSLSQQRLRSLIPEVIRKYNVPKDRFIIGGHSAGGNGAMLYAEYAYGPNSESFVKPRAVFGVDPPLDMQRFWNTMIYIDKINFSKPAVDEAKYFLNRLRTELGGTPVEKAAAYEKISSFCRAVPYGGKARYLKSVPVRLYCDPDIQWYLTNRRMPYEHINAADLSACIAQLKLLGNEKAELITNLGKGYFSSGMRHPHGFSQLDSVEFLNWASALMKSE